MTFIMLLFFLSIYGAFIGPERAKAFFNSVPMAIYWIAFIFLLVIGIVLFRRLIQVPALLFTHFGCILILLGGIWSSNSGHELQKKVFGINKIPSGYMQIYEEHADNIVIAENDIQYELPFSIALKDFRIEYYKPSDLYIQTRQGEDWKIPIEEGKVYSPDSTFGTIEIVKVFSNFKMITENGIRNAIDDPGPGSNPAIEVKVTPPDGESLTRYIFDFSRSYIYSDDFAMAFEIDIKEYISELQVIQDNKVVAVKDIEVNHPLYYGGYHFYQQDYDHEEGRYTILKVTSNSGLYFVYAGYFMLCIGVCWHFWLKKLRSKGA
ncbi:MAG: cytochrome c biogenesis protein ResB [Sedimentisphaerales bacterium]|nr:cytochrome c biogenesis protein ResB [Sedimentisphaerales bacterium]